MPKTSLLPIVGNNGEKAAFIVVYNYGKMDSPFAGASFLRRTTIDSAQIWQKRKKKSALGKTFPSINSVMRERKVLTIRPAIHQKSPLKYELVKITNHNFSGL